MLLATTRKKLSFKTNAEKIEELVNRIFYVKFAILFILQKKINSHTHSLTHQTHTHVYSDQNMVTKTSGTLKNMQKNKLYRQCPYHTLKRKEERKGGRMPVMKFIKVVLFSFS